MTESLGQYVDPGFAKRIEFWEFFLLLIPNIENNIVLNLVILTLAANEE